MSLKKQIFGALEKASEPQKKYFEPSKQLMSLRKKIFGAFDAFEDI